MALTDLLTAKITSMVVLFALSMIVGCIPLLLSLKFNWFKKTSSDIRTNKLVVGLLAFGGGVLFATSFLHLLPEVDENISELQESGEIADLPIYLAGVIMSAGFFMMYLIEELVHIYIKHSGKKSEELVRVMSVRRSSSQVAIPEKTKDVEEAKVDSHIPVIEDDTISGVFRGLLIVLALSIHELFEGLAIGLENSVGNVWYMFAAVSAHKYLIGFCIGVELLAAGTKKWLSVVYIFVFSFASAFGIGVGALMTDAGDFTVASAILQGLACGTLVYVVFFEVWKREGSSFAVFLWSFLGFFVMGLIQFITEIFFES